MNDSLFGGAGDDTIWGGWHLNAYFGDDYVDGGAGDDLINVSTSLYRGPDLLHMPRTILTRFTVVMGMIQLHHQLVIKLLLLR